MCNYKQLNKICKDCFAELIRMDEEQHKIFLIFVYFIHVLPRLSQLYLSWSNLTNHQRYMFNVQVKRSLEETQRYVYAPIIRSLDYWEFLQNIYGAPGYESNPLEHEVSPETDTHILNALVVMETVMQQMQLKRKLNEDIKSIEDPMEMFRCLRNLRALRNFTRTRSHMTIMNQITEEPGTSMTDLNGCGDNSFYEID